MNFDHVNLEQLGQEEAASIGVIAGKDGPTAAYRAPVFRFHKGQTEMTVTPQEDEVEEVDLSDVACFDYDPTLPQPSAQEAEAPAVPQAAEIEAQPKREPAAPRMAGPGRREPYGPPSWMRMTACSLNKAGGRIWEWRS